ncbi:MAG: Mpo1-like protein [Candidatus Omnitrophota bacterium]|nr:Mpo1-like protein [Candidatus Omnitrophota bacterium]
MFIKNYLSRHVNNVNRVLHIIGVPQAFFGLFQIITGKWVIGAVNLFLGYLWQWLGHTHFEKNEVGEVILIKKLIQKCRKM